MEAAKLVQGTKGAAILSFRSRNPTVNLKGVKFAAHTNDFLFLFVIVLMETMGLEPISLTCKVNILPTKLYPHSFYSIPVLLRAKLTASIYLHIKDNHYLVISENIFAAAALFGKSAAK